MKNASSFGLIDAEWFAKYQGRIIGGEDTTIEKFPHQCSLQYNGRHICGGSIVNPRTIITAAHCRIGGASISDFSIQVGSTKHDRDEHAQVLAITQFFKHPEYNSRRSNNDIAIITLEEPLRITEKVKPIELPESGEMLAEGTLITVTGWGLTKEGGKELPEALKAVNKPIISLEKCNKLYRNRISLDMLCAGLPQGGADACQGDSGGPLVVNNKLYGVVSWGDGCGRPKAPGVYARVSHFVDWIYENTDSNDWLY